MSKQDRGSGRGAATGPAASSPRPGSQTPRGAAASMHAAPAPASASNSASAGSSKTPDLSQYLGLPLQLTLSNEKAPVVGLLFAHDVSTGLVVLETGFHPTKSVAPYPLKAAAAPTTKRNQAVVAAQGGAPRADPTGFKLIKERTIKSVTVLPSSSEANGNAKPSGADEIFAKSLTAIGPVNVSIAEKREAAATREAQVRASKIGPAGVSEIGQDIFEAFSKTMPCRWHEKHIIIMDEVVLSDPYDAASLRVPQYSDSLIQKLLDSSSVSASELPKGDDVATARGKARHWERVRRVLEGERKKIEQRRGVQAAA